MLVDSRHTFDEAMSALLGGGRPDVVADDIHETDRRINALEQEIRRELVVHASVRGTADITAVMIMLMVSRKIERIGDNAKNIYDLAADGVDLSNADDLPVLSGYRDELSSLISTAAEIFDANDRVGGARFVARAVELQREFDERTSGLIHSSEPSSQGVPRALLYRYFKRIVANLEGIVSTVVNPLDLVDYNATGDVELD